MKRAFSFIVLFFAVLHGFAQVSEIKTLAFDTILFSGINPAGELYVMSEKEILKFDKDGAINQSLTLPHAHTITSFDSWHLTQVVLYYRAEQKIEIYNPQLEPRISFTIDSSFAIEPYLVTSSTDEKSSWIFDAADISLKKVNPVTNQVFVDVIVSDLISSAHDVVSMREYQRFLFLQTNNSLLVFNAMGKKIRTIETPTGARFDFFGEEIVLLHKNTIQFINLFSSDQRQILLSKSFKKVLLTDDRFFGVTENTIEIFEFQPN
jgi:hypothetical protein